MAGKTATGGPAPTRTGRKLCKLAGKKFLKKHMDEYLALVRDPKYVCTKCGRLSHYKKNLCKPEKL